MQQIEKFLAEYDNFELDSLEDYLPEEVLIEDGKPTRPGRTNTTATAISGFGCFV
jgi:hypothetical protein